MKTMLPMRLVMCGAVALLPHISHAQSWQTVDDFLPGNGIVQAMASDPVGNLYAAGQAEDPSINTSAQLRKSSDGGNTWSVVDFFPNLATTSDSYLYEYKGITSDAVGKLYAVGDDFWNGNWFVRRSFDGGLSWQTVDVLFGGANAVAADAAGNVYVTGASHGWTVRKSSDAGGSWSTIDTLVAQSSSANGVLCHPTAGVFVAGQATVTTGTGKKTTTQGYWYVRRSLDAGDTWSTVDAYLGGSARAIKSDAVGNIYVVGANNGHWIVRKSANGGASWATVDDFVPSCVTISTHPLRTQCFTAQALSVASDSHGNVFVAGFTETNNGGQWVDQWVVRMNPTGTSTWQTVDSFQYVAGTSSTAHAAVDDSAGNVFVGGGGVGAGGEHWLVRKLPAP